MLNASELRLISDLADLNRLYSHPRYMLDISLELPEESVFTHLFYLETVVHLLLKIYSICDKIILNGYRYDIPTHYKVVASQTFLNNLALVNPSFRQNMATAQLAYSESTSAQPKACKKGPLPR